MLVNGGNSSASPSSSSSAVSADVNFARGDKVSASVRLRSKSRKGGEGNSSNGRGALAERSRLLSRHSGDFGHLSAASKMELVGAASSRESGHPTDNDWAYITYPNGVPTVQEVRELTTSEASEMPKRTPVKVVTREVPGISLAGLKLSAEGGGVGGTDSPTSTASSSSSKNRFRGNGRNSNSPAAASSVAASTVAAKSSEENVRFRRRLSEQPPNVANVASMASASSKRCSGEFQFVRTAKNGLVSDVCEVTDSEQNNKEGGGGTPKGRIPSRGAARGPGLGRRAATQVQIERGERKNSYSSAMYKSQDNLVKATVMSDDASLEKSPACTLRKGTLWQQRDKIFSRWKERFFVLTPDYLNCFERGTSRMSEMGEFLFKLRVSEIDDVELLDKRGYLTICVSLLKDGKIYLRKTEGIREWFRGIRDCHRDCLQKRRVAENPSSSPANAFWQRKQMTDSTSIEQWMANRKKKLLHHQTSLTHLASAFSDSTPDIVTKAAALAGTSIGAGEPRITLDELSDLYRRAESDLDPGVDAAIPPGEDAEQQQQQQNRLLSAVVTSPLTTGVKLRIKDGGGVSGGGAGGRKIINRLSLMSDIELPDFGDLDRNVFLKKKKMLDSHSSSDSGNNSISTNASVGSSGSANSKDLKDVDVGRDQQPQQHPPHQHPRQQLPPHQQQHRASPRSSQLQPPPPPPAQTVTNGVQMRQRSRDNNSCHDRLSHAQHLPQQQHRFAPHRGVGVGGVGGGDDRPNMNIKHMMSKQQMQQQIRNHRRASAYGALGGNNGVQITHV